MFNIHLNNHQRKELSKAFFNLGNIIAGAVTFGTFMFGSFCVVIVFSGAILLLKTERN